MIPGIIYGVKNRGVGAAVYPGSQLDVIYESGLAFEQ